MPSSLAALNRLISTTAPGVVGGTRAVVGEGPVGAALALVGEQPGDREDIEGRPFVGPAGKILDAALREAGIDRSSCYVTNAVKHFKFTERGKRRLHQKPTGGEIKHYRWWLLTELDLVAPRVVVAMGATAAQALAGKPVSISRDRGATTFANRRGLVTIHPSYILRLRGDDRREAFDGFVADLAKARAMAG